VVYSGQRTGGREGQEYFVSRKTAKKKRWKNEKGRKKEEKKIQTKKKERKENVEQNRM